MKNIKKYSINIVFLVAIFLMVAIFCTPTFYGTFAKTTAELPKKVQNQWFDGANFLNFNDSLSAVNDMLNAMTQEEKANRKNDPIVVAVLDTGINFQHDIFQGLLYENKNEIKNNNIDDDHNGFNDDICGWDFVSNDNDSNDECTSPNSHGTHVCSIVAREIIKYNLQDYIKILPLRTGNHKGSFMHTAVINAINYCISQNVDVINMSFCNSMYGQWGKNSTLHKTIQKAVDNNIVVVAAAGNNNTASDSGVYSPAGFDEVVGVMAYEEDLEGGHLWTKSLSVGSNYGDRYDVVAPGDLIYGAVRSEYTSVNGSYINVNGNGYDVKSGTSMASPIVSFMSAALMIKYNNNSNKVVYALKNGSSQKVNSYNKAVLCDYLNYNAISKIEINTVSGNLHQKVTENEEVVFSADIFDDNNIKIDGQNAIYDKLYWYVQFVDKNGNTVDIENENNIGRTFSFTPHDVAGTYRVYTKLEKYLNFSEKKDIVVNYVDKDEVELKVNGQNKINAKNQYEWSIDNYQYVDQSFNSVLWKVYKDNKLLLVSSDATLKFTPKDQGNYVIECSINGQNLDTINIKVLMNEKEIATICGGVATGVLISIVLAIIICFILKRAKV